MGNTQQQGKYFIKAVNAFNSNSKRRFRRLQFSDEDDELDGEEDVPFVNEFDGGENLDDFDFLSVTALIVNLVL